MKVLAIDPGYDRLGLAVIDDHNKQPTVIYSHCQQTDKKTIYQERLLIVANCINDTINQYQPEIIAIESIFFANNQKTAIKIAEVRGVIIYLASLNNLLVKEYSPLEIKMTVAGWGGADKKQVASMVKKLCLNDWSKKMLDDEYDAIALGLTCLSRYRLT